MRNKRLVFASLVLGFFWLILMPGMAEAQCNLKLESKVELSASGRSGNIYLKVKKGSGRLNLYLFDLQKSRKGPVRQESRSASELKDDFVLVFENVPASTYTVQVVDSRKCQVSVGGIKGISFSGN